MGVLIGIANAFTVGFLDVFLKKLSGMNPNFLTWVRMASAAPVLLLLVAIFRQWAIPPFQFWLLIGGIILPLEITFAYLGTKAIQLSPLSLVAPLGAFTSIFLIPVGYFILGELPTFIGGIGVFSIVIGSFFLGLRSEENGFRSNFVNVLRERGVWFALLGALASSVAVTVTKLTFRYAPPLFSAFSVVSLMAVVLLPAVFLQERTAVRIRAKHLAGVSVISGGGIALHNLGLSLLPAVYYISIKRLSILINVIFGRVFFHEDHIRERFFGAVFMVAGVILIAAG